MQQEIAQFALNTANDPDVLALVDVAAKIGGLLFTLWVALKGALGLVAKIAGARLGAILSAIGGALSFRRAGPSPLAQAVLDSLTPEGALVQGDLLACPAVAVVFGHYETKKGETVAKWIAPEVLVGNTDPCFAKLSTREGKLVLAKAKQVRDAVLAGEDAIARQLLVEALRAVPGRPPVR